MRVCWIVIVLVFLVSLLPATAEGRAVLSGNTINIWSGSPAVQHEDNCTTLLADVPTKVMSCTSTFASTCISVHASLNITRGSAGNWTNFSVDGCELRMNMTADGSSIINNWGNFTVISSRITTNSSGRESAIIIKADSNFSMTNSFVSEMGWSNLANRRGLELNSPTFVFDNNTLASDYIGITLYSGASGSVLTNIAANSNAYLGILLSSSSSNTLTNIAANSNSQHGIYLSSSSSNTFANIDIWRCSTSAVRYACIYLAESSSNTFIQGTVSLTRANLTVIQNSNNTLFQDIQFINETPIMGGINITSTAATAKSIENTFLNTTFTGVTESVSGDSQLIRQWYADVYTSPAVNGANITIRNSTQSLINYSYTNSTGWIQRLNLTAYINDSGSVSQWQPYNFSAFASGYANVSDQYEALDANMVVAITLTPTCIPDCAGRECGPDPICGTSCGPCSGVCSNGLCCGNGVCSTNENCPADSSGCATQICRTASCTSGCVYTNILNGQEDPGYCDGPNQCDGNGGCIPDESEPPPPPSGATPGFEPGLLIIFFSALLAGLLLPIASTRR